MWRAIWASADVVERRSGVAVICVPREVANVLAINRFPHDQVGFDLGSSKDDIHTSVNLSISRDSSKPYCAYSSMYYELYLNCCSCLEGKTVDML